MSEIKLVIKRDGRIVPFTQERITNAIYRAVGVRIKELPLTPEKILKGL
jgi:CO/xanthine dehydrogenase Mo-binding subunit